MSIPKELSLGEEMLVLHLKAYGIRQDEHYVREYPFASPRKWRADFAFVPQMLLVEVEGGTRHGGRHNRHEGFTADCQKYNAATLRGYRVLRFTTGMVESSEAVDTIRKALGI